MALATPPESAPPWLSCRAKWPMAQSLHPPSVTPPPYIEHKTPSEPNWEILGAKQDSTARVSGRRTAVV